MAKKIKVVEKRAPTKRQLARWEKEKKRQKVVSIVAVVSISVIVLLLGIGYYITQVRPWGQVIVDVNGVTYDMRYITKVVKILGGGGDLQRTQTLASYAPGWVRDQELIRQGVKKQGITVTAEEIDQKLREVVLGDNPDEAARKDFNKEYNDRLKAVQMSDAEYRGIVEMEVLQAKYKAALGDKMPQKVEQVHVVGMLLTNPNVDAANTRLKNGEDFAAIAKELSVHTDSKEKGGDLGWLPRGIMGDKFDETAFSLEVGKVSDRIPDEANQSAEAYWLVKVTEKDSQRDLDPKHKTRLVDNQFNKWIESERGAEANKITLNWGKEQLDWVTRKVK